MKSNKGTKTLVIGELYLQLRAVDLAGLTLDTAVAKDFDVLVEYTYNPGEAASFEDDGMPTEIEAKAIKASANILFGGDASDVTIKRGTDIISLFTGAEVAAIEDRIYFLIQAGGNDDA